ncbi:MAG: PD-(D/E)XK motif protein [Clostridium sp.]|uniref:PD-(D/E)XK motif protein n=1 Tax=Clostridium sp. TaxID=1506 RepID=UPI003D6D412D
MDYNHFVVKWKSASIDHIRIDNMHPLDFYLSKGVHGESRLVFIGGYRKVKIKDSDIIKVDIGKRSDNRYSYSFMLMDENFSDQFYRLCYDLIDSSRGCDKNEESYRYVLNLFLKWKRMMRASGNTKLSIEEIKGLIGELMILYRELNLGRDSEELINSWQGPEGYYQDFIFSDTWYEIKAITKRSEKISISSVEQLDVNIEGILYTITLDKVDSVTNNTIDLNSIINMIKEKLKDYLTQLDKFIVRLDLMGYSYSKEYDEYIFEIGKIKSYSVDDNFPRLRRKNLPIEIAKVKYEIIISCINDWLVGEEEWN